MFSRRDPHERPRLSPFTPYTGLLALLWLLLVAYIITHPDPIGVIILIVMGVFIVAPMLFMWLLIFGAKRRRARNDPAGEYETPAGRNGRYTTDANGAQAGQQQEPDDILGEIPEEGGENP